MSRLNPIRTGYIAPVNKDGTAMMETPLQRTYDALKGTYKDIPTPAQWATDTRNITPCVKDGEISVLLGRYHQPGLDRFAKLYISNDLCEVVDGWLKLPQMPGGPAASQKLQQARNALMYELFKVTVMKLCEGLECHVNVLPERLNRTFVQMQHTQPGEAVSYLDDIGRERYRLIIYGGRFEGWYDNGYAPVNTNHPNFAAANHGFVEGDLECEAGFVLSHWNEIYMRKHGMNIRCYHSQYMGGKMVVCAGEMTIRDGRLLKVSNASGHYQPPPQTLIPLLWLLARKGVALNDVRVLAFEESSQQNRMYGEECSAMEFLAKGGKPTQGVTRWMEDPNNVWGKLQTVTGRVTLPAVRPPGSYEIDFNAAGDPRLYCMGKIAPDGTYSLETQGPKTRKVPGAPIRNDYEVVVSLPEPGGAQTYWELGTFRVRDGNYTMDFVIP